MLTHQSPLRTNKVQHNCKWFPQCTCQKTLEQLKAPRLSELSEQSHLDQNQTIGNSNEPRQHETDQNQEQSNLQQTRAS